jgi:DNA/RNA-binding domain of Phe-tRNA-synthetase-like protein
MRFSHSDAIWTDFPELAAGVIHARGITPGVDAGAAVARYDALAAARLGGGAESELPEIQAWRRAFSRMGLKPTQYRCASEALLRRFRKEGALPRIHPLIDLCNAMSLAFAIPVAALDVGRIAWPLEVRRAAGSESYETFGGEIEHPEPGEVVFADAEERAHARRWTNRQSGRSAVRDATCEVLIVAEALHDGAAADIARLVEALAGELRAHWAVAPATAVLRCDAPAFEFTAAAG